MKYLINYACLVELLYPLTRCRDRRSVQSGKYCARQLRCIAHGHEPPILTIIQDVAWAALAVGTDHRTTACQRLYQRVGESLVARTHHIQTGAPHVLEWVRFEARHLHTVANPQFYRKALKWLAFGAFTQYERGRASMFLQLPQWWGYGLASLAAVLWTACCLWTCGQRLGSALGRGPRP